MHIFLDFFGDSSLDYGIVAQVDSKFCTAIYAEYILLLSLYSVTYAKTEDQEMIHVRCSQPLLALDPFQ